VQQRKKWAIFCGFMSVFVKSTPKKGKIFRRLRGKNSPQRKKKGDSAFFDKIPSILNSKILG